MKAYDITKLTVELKSDNVPSRNKIIHITVVVVNSPRCEGLTQSINRKGEG